MGFFGNKDSRKELRDAQDALESVGKRERATAKREGRRPDETEEYHRANARVIRAEKNVPSSKWF